MGRWVGTTEAAEHFGIGRAWLTAKAANGHDDITARRRNGSNRWEIFIDDGPPDDDDVDAEIELMRAIAAAEPRARKGALEWAVDRYLT